MAQTRTMDVQDFISAHKLSRFQITTIGLCFLIVAIDGFDTAAIGFIAPALRAEWQLSAAQLAPLFGAGLLGLMVGAFASARSPTGSAASDRTCSAGCSSAIPGATRDREPCSRPGRQEPDRLDGRRSATCR